MILFLQTLISARFFFENKRRTYLFFCESSLKSQTVQGFQKKKNIKNSPSRWGIKI